MNALTDFWNFSVNVVTKETTSNHISTKLSMSLPVTQIYQPFDNTSENIILFLPPLIAAKTPLKIHLFLPTAALATPAIPSYVLKLQHPKLHLLRHQK